MTEATELLERETPIIENPKKLLDIRQEVDKRIEYSKAVRELIENKDGIKLPERSSELVNGLDAKAHDLSQSIGTEREKKSKDVPSYALDQQNEEFWTQIGWEKETRTQVTDKLRDVLGIGDIQAKSAMECLVAGGKTPDEVLQTLNTAPAFDQYPDREAPEADRLQRLLQQDRIVSVSGDPRSAMKIMFIEDKLGITNQAYVYRFILNEELRDGLNSYRNQNPAENLFDIAWNIMAFGKEKEYAMDKAFPLLKMQVNLKKDSSGRPIVRKGTDGTPLTTKDGKPMYEIETDPEKGKGRYVISEANFLRWLRGRMFDRWAKIETDDPVDFYQVIDVYKGQYSTISLMAMIFDDGRYFRDETGYKWEDLYGQVFIEPFNLIYDRQYDIGYRKAKGNEEELAKAYRDMSDLSKWTRKIAGQSMIGRAIMAPVDFTGKDSDASLGEAFLTMYLTMYHLADFDAMEKILGKDSDFFKRETWIKAAKEIAEGTMSQTGGAFMTHAFGVREDHFNKAFDKDGSIKDKKAFTKLINPFYEETPPQNLTKTLEEVLKMSVKEKFRSKEVSEDIKNSEDKETRDRAIDTDSLNYAWLKAYSWMSFTGGWSKNNWTDEGGPAGWLAGSKLDFTDAYRWKYGTFGGSGNPYTIHMFKQMGVPMLEGMVLENAFERAIDGYGPDGTPILNDKKMKDQRFRTPMEVMLLMREANAEFEAKLKPLQERRTDPTLSDAERKSIEAEIARIEDESRNTSKSWGSMLEFNDNAMNVWAKNLFSRGAHLYNSLMKGKETDFDKFMTYSGPFKGVTFKREEWQSAIQEQYITPLRYFFEANGATQLNMKVRAPALVGWTKDGKPKWEWKEQYLGERLLGHQIVDIPEFRLKADQVAPDNWKWMKKEGYRKRGKYLVDRKGKHVINWDEVQEHKTVVWKQWLLMKIAGDLLSHVDRHSTDASYSMDHYEKIVTAIKELPGNIMGSEFNMNDTTITKYLFDEEQMEWLEKLAKVTPTQLFNREFWKNIVMGNPHQKGSMFGDSTSIIMNAIFRGK